MNNFKYLLTVGLAFLVLSSCKVEVPGPLDPDTGAPAPVTNIQVENLPGAAKITYRLPNDQKLLYVKAECMINGKMVEAKSSPYNNELLIEGFGATGEQEVKLYSVSLSETKSEPLVVKVNPLTPAYEDTFKSIALRETFGGASVTFDNPTEANLVIQILVQQTDGDWKVAETYYTKKANGVFSARGFDPKPTNFAVFVKDRWNNYSDTLTKELVPVFEKQLDRTKFREVSLPTDQLAAFGWTMPYLWDGVIVNNTNVDKPGFHTSPNGVWPQWFTFSLGVKARLSRFKYWQRGSWVAFTDRNIKKFEIWGSNNPAQDGSWDSWTKLMDGTSVKPSGLPMGTNSPEDIALVGAGEEFIFPDNTPEVQYIRIKVLETWSGSKSFYIMQVGFWGADQ